ncbi:hypothetical protein JL100_032880 (plasmid) [Skermanella mucosa]|uniref:lipase/acyltransferase domain-containing protein n=1 Tax=Skermanella mucosa TaxID=1789672 RepID=UPI00192BC561|nr:hypothetical protein [Skermanella mucosa]UEM24415.1 hypothetical protein JL100_032880 [Skermanella mucosa]
MTTVVVVPGIFGVQMINSDGEMIWPPGMMTRPIAGDTLVRYLLDEQCKHGRIIERAPCLGKVYGDLISALIKMSGVRVEAYHYDWRLDLIQQSDLLAKFLNRIDDGNEIVLIGHSMGGLISRLLLESGRHDDEAWFGRITKFVAIAVPHLGAPLALLRLVGQNGLSSFFMSGGNMKMLGSNPEKFPSGYQLLPAPGYDCYDETGGSPNSLVETAAKFNLQGSGIKALERVHKILGHFDTPNSVAYYLAVGDKHNTIGQLRINASGVIDGMTEPGDGTVPLWSALPQRFSHLPSSRYASDHVGIVGDVLLHAHLREILEQPSRAIPPVLQLFPTWRDIRPRDRVPVTLAATFSLKNVSGQVKLIELKSGAVVYDTQLPPIASESKSIQLSLPSLETEGVYRLSFKAPGLPVATVRLVATESHEDANGLLQQVDTIDHEF